MRLQVWRVDGALGDKRPTKNLRVIVERVWGDPRPFPKTPKFETPKLELISPKL